VSDPDRRRSPDGFDDDVIFADIVAHLNDDADLDERPARSVAEDSATDDESTEPSQGESTEPPPRSPAEPPPGDPQPVRAPQVWRAHEVDAEYEEHFEPPPVAPVPVGDLQFWAIIAGMAGGPLLLVYLVFFHREGSGYWILAAIAMCVGGFALLVSRLPGSHGDDDDGARL